MFWGEGAPVRHIHVDNSSAGELLSYLCFLLRLASKVYIQQHRDPVVLPSLRLEPEMLWLLATKQHYFQRII